MLKRSSIIIGVVLYFLVMTMYIMMSEPNTSCNTNVIVAVGSDCLTTDGTIIRRIDDTRKDY